LSTQDSASKPRVAKGIKLPFALQDDEVVLKVARRHWLYFSLRLGGEVGAGVLLTVVAVLLVNWTYGFDGIAGRVTIGVLALWVLYWAIRTYFTWYRYQNDIWTVTNQRLVDSIKRHWFHHLMASADLVDVEDIRIVRSGFLQTVFNFGDVRCQTAGEVPNFVLDGIPDPAGVMAVVDASRDAARKALRGLV
jgi:hypothetical protein